MNWLDIEEQDNPSLMVSRFKDAPGMLKRLGFSRYKNRSYSRGSRSWIYVLLVKLRGAGLEAPRGSRKISHIRFELDDVWERTYEEVTCVHLRVRFGYPTSRARRNKIEVSFVDLEHQDSARIYLGSNLQYGQFERVMNNLKLKLSLFERRSAEISDLRKAIGAELGACKDHEESYTGRFWIEEHEAPIQSDDRVKPEAKISHRRTGVDHRWRMLRPSGRPH